MRGWDSGWTAPVPVGATQLRLAGVQSTWKAAPIVGCGLCSLASRSNWEAKVKPTYAPLESSGKTKFDWPPLSVSQVGIAALSFVMKPEASELLVEGTRKTSVVIPFSVAPVKDWRDQHSGSSLCLVYSGSGVTSLVVVSLYSHQLRTSHGLSIELVGRYTKWAQPALS